MSIPRFLFLALALALLTTGCGDDDPARPSSPTFAWRDVDLGFQHAGSALLSVHVAGDHGVALGVHPDGSQPDGLARSLYSLGADGLWSARSMVDLPDGISVLAAAVDASDGLVLVGYEGRAANAGRLVDARGPAPVAVSTPSRGLLMVNGVGSFFVAGGYSQGGQLWTSFAPGQWTEDGLPLTGTNDSGIHDVAIRGDVAVACGFDDGADTLQVVLTRTRTTAWEKVPLGDGHFSRTFHSVALSETGTIYVGGDVRTGDQSYRGFLIEQTSPGQWTEIDLPDAEQTGRVNDILIASDGDLYLACSGRVGNNLASIIRLAAFGARHEVTPFPGELNQLAEGPDGRIYAVGMRRSGGGVVLETAVMLVRERI